MGHQFFGAPLSNMEYIYEAEGKYTKDLRPPILICTECKQITYPPPGAIRIRCRCGKVYQLGTANGRPINKLPVR